MISRVLQFFILISILTTGAVVGVGQVADNSVLPPRPGEKEDDRPKSLRETLEKMRIEKEKKDFQEMLDRGQEALKLTEDLEKSVATTGRLTEREYTKIASVEKLVKKIRNDLGGSDEEDGNSEVSTAKSSSLSPIEAVKTLREAASSLIGELKKTTRFTISAAAIEGTNAIIRVARFLRITK